MFVTHQVLHPRKSKKKVRYPASLKTMSSYRYTNGALSMLKISFNRGAQWAMSQNRYVLELQRMRTLQMVNLDV